MTESKPDPRDVETRPISVAELLAKNGSIGSPPVTGRRRRRRGNADAVTVAELTGEIPIIRDEIPPEPAPETPPAGGADGEPSGALPIGPAPGFVEDEQPTTGPRPAQRVESAPRRSAEQRWPKSPPQPPRVTGPQQSPYPRPQRRSEPPVVEKPQPDDVRAAGSGAERMRPDPVDVYTGIDLDALNAEARGTELNTGDSAFVRSILTQGSPTERAIGSALAADPDVDTVDAGRDGATAEADPADQYVGRPGVVGGLLVVLQSILAVAFGGGLFIAFDQLWRWNSIVALVLTVLVTLGLVAAVQAVRKTVDIVSTLIAVAVGLLVTLGPLALHAN
ncbi:hypothetical protein BST33_02715 [Mycolicibacter minnesotensis]|uniref:Uncharacterized protein n=1 Tax=Mycolicibacter minnesotensis TaxID=1118379 RepID=A0A7I7R656_9MYCO|nr:hypothetical protein [Mycolicibacter minnesotensis]ORB03861.1 hypothetical protein BST33_02715 [Mycolicibacter minnesotensis]BBY34143.1 hypothetical protein MMIN_22040 [Mycolicibacter minnesotensis]